MAELTAQDKERRIKAKRHNERMKIMATFLNNLALAFLIGGFVTPYIRGDNSGFGFETLLFFVLTAAFHVIAWQPLKTMKSED